MNDIHVRLVDRTSPLLVLVFTDSHGRVISIHGQLFDLLGYDDPGLVVGEPLSTVLGIDYDASKHLVENVAQNGSVFDWALEIHSQAADPTLVSCTSVATFNDRGDFMGVDITLYKPTHPIAAEARPLGHKNTILTHIQQVQAGGLSQEDQAPLQLYTTVQFSALQVLLARMAGLRVSKTLEVAINKMADQKDWPVSIKGDRLLLKQDEVQPETYRALLDETARFVANVIGRRTVEARMRAVDEHMNMHTVQLAEQAGLRHFFQGR